jgi:predicted dehydrogenase
MTTTRPPQGSREVGIGLIGCGHIAQLRHVQALTRIRGARVKAVADVDSTARNRVGEALGVERRHSSAEQLLEDHAVDAVGVLVPPSAHPEVAAAALEAGKHVLVEKPLALTIEGCDRLIEAARERPELVATVAFNLRFHRLLQQARSLVEAGKLGRLDSISAVSTGCAADLDIGDYLTGWRGSRDQGGGALIEKGIHHYDLWRFLVGGEVEEISTMSRSEEGDDRAAVVIGRMRDGTLVSSILGHARADSHGVTLHGNDAVLEVAMHDFDGLRLRPAGTYSGAIGWRAKRALAVLTNAPRALRGLREGGDFIRSYTEEWRHFVRCVRGEAEVECTLEDGREAVRVALAVVESARTGETVLVAGVSGAALAA